MNIIGIDPDQLSVNITKLRISNPELAKVDNGENLSFKDGSFDMVVSKTVIEHAQNPKKYLNEVYRVLKPGGTFIILAPNYLFPWEGHYKIFWFPFLLPYTKNIFKLFIKIIKRKVEPLNFINFKITPYFLKKNLKKIGFSQIINISAERFKERLNNPSLIANPGPKKIMIFLKKSKIFSHLLDIFTFMLMALKLYHPIILIVKK